MHAALLLELGYVLFLDREPYAAGAQGYLLADKYVLRSSAQHVPLAEDTRVYEVLDSLLESGPCQHGFLAARYAVPACALYSAVEAHRVCEKPHVPEAHYQSLVVYGLHDLVRYHVPRGLYPVCLQYLERVVAVRARAVNSLHLCHLFEVASCSD